MKYISNGSRRRIKAALCAVLCLSMLLLSGCARKQNTIIVVGGTTAIPMDISQPVPAVATLEPTAIPGATQAPDDGSDVAWELSGEMPDVTQAPAAENPASALEQIMSTAGSDVAIGFVANNNYSFAPYECTERDLISLNQLMFESVVELDANQQPVPLLADRWTVEEGGKFTVWTFELRSGIKFHNGVTLSSQDVINSYMAYAAMDGVVNPYTEYMKFIDHMEYVTDTVFRVYAVYPGYITLYAMTFPVMETSSITSAMPRGTGPYWMISYTPGMSMRLESNPLWWKRGGNVHSIVGLNYANTASALMALDSGAIDMLATRSYSASQSRNLSNMVSMDFTTGTYELLVPNLSHSSVLSDLDVRKAIMYAIDRTKVQSNGYLSMLQSSEVPVIPGTWLYETQSAKYYYSPERALQLLYDAGWSDSNGDGILDRVRDGLLQELSFTIHTYTEDTVSVRPNAAQEISDDLIAIGIRAEVVTTTREKLQKALRAGEFDMALIGVNLSTIPNPGVLVSSGSSLNYSKYVDPTMDSMCESVRSASDEFSMKTLFSGIQMQIVNDLPIMGLGYHIGAVLSHTTLNGLAGLREYDVWNGMELMTK